MIKLKIIIGSTREGRFGIQPAKWIYELAKKESDLDVELVDLKELKLSFLEEKELVTADIIQVEKWRNTVGEADAFIFVTPEYNHSYSGVLKNAIDHLQIEWNHKPVAFVSYGSIAGGARAAEHLRAVAGELRMFDLKDQILLSNYWAGLDENGNYKFGQEEERAAETIITQLSFWGKMMKSARVDINGEIKDSPETIESPEDSVV